MTNQIKMPEALNKKKVDLSQEHLKRNNAWLSFQMGFEACWSEVSKTTQAPRAMKAYLDLEVAIEALQKISLRCWNPGPDANNDNCQCNGCTARAALKKIRGESE